MNFLTFTQLTSQLFENFNKLFDKSLVFRKFFVVIFSSIAVFSSAAACTLPGLGGNNTPNTTYGVLKRDPSVRSDGFGPVRRIKGQDCDNSSCLSGLSGIKLLQVDDQNIYFLSRNKGLFRTTDGGREWERLYFFPIDNVETKKTVQNDKGERVQIDKTRDEIDSEISSKIAQNDAFAASDFTVDLREPTRIYVSGIFDGIGRILQSVDSGKSFVEIYKEVDRNISVKMVAIHSKSSQRIFGILEKGAMIRSMDSGVTWQKVRSFKETPIQMGFVPEFDNLFFALFPSLGLATSTDDGETWQTQELTRENSKIGETQNRDKFEANPFAGKERFGTYEKVIPVVRGAVYLDENQKNNQIFSKVSSNQNPNSQNLQNSSQSNFNLPNLPTIELPFGSKTNNSNNDSQKSEAKNSSQIKTLPSPKINLPFLLIADRQVWFAVSPSENFTKLVLPVQNEQYNILDAAPDPRVGLDKILVSVDNTIFETQNRGLSWSLKDKVQIKTPIGNVGQILIDKNNSEIIYLMLVDAKAKRGTGFIL